MANANFFSGIKVNLDAKAIAGELVVGGLYFTTDTKELCRAIAVDRYDIISQQLIVVENLPETAYGVQGKLYLRTSDSTLHVFNGSDFKELSASSNVLTISNVSDDLDADDSLLLVNKDAIKSAINDVKDSVNAVDTKVGVEATQDTEATGLFKNVADLVAKDTELEGKIDANAVILNGDPENPDDKGLIGAIEIINGESNIAGSIKKAEADAKSYADTKITELVNGAPEAMNTLSELAEAINNNKDIYDAYVNTISAKVGQKANENAEGDPVVSSGLYKEIEDAVNTEKLRAEAAEGELDTKVLAAEGDIDNLQALVGNKKVEGDEPVAATGLCADIDNVNAALTTEATDRAAADEGLQDAIDIINGDAETVGSIEYKIKQFASLEWKDF